MCFCTKLDFAVPVGGAALKQTSSVPTVTAVSASTAKLTPTRVNPTNSSDGSFGDLSNFTDVESVLKEVSRKVVAQKGSLGVDESTYMNYTQIKINYDVKFPQVFLRKI